MTRKAFLQQFGIGAAFVLTVPCLHSCGGDDDGEVPRAPDRDFTVDLTDPDNAALLSAGGFVVRNKVVIANSPNGGYAAASLICSHEGNEEVSYLASEDEWACSVHGARFRKTDGEPTNDITDRNLRIYTTTLSTDGNTLRIS